VPKTDIEGALADFFACCGILSNPNMCVLKRTQLLVQGIGIKFVG